MRLKKLFGAVVFSAIAIVMADAQTTISLWNFNSTTPDAIASTGTTSPAIGSGSLSVIGGTSSSFVSGSPGDPANAGGDNSGLSLASWAPQGTGSGTRGLQIASSTEGFWNITLSLDFRQSSTASRYFQLQVSSDGATFNNVSGGTASFGTVNNNSGTSFTSDGLYSNITSGSSQTFVQSIRYALPTGSVYENNALFAFRWVAVFDPGSGNSYTAAAAGNSYGTTGTGRFDEVGIVGSSIVATPEPSTFALSGLGLAALWHFHRRKD